MLRDLLTLFAMVWKNVLGVVCACCVKMAQNTASWMRRHTSMRALAGNTLKKRLISGQPPRAPSNIAQKRWNHHQLGLEEYPAH